VTLIHVTSRTLGSDHSKQHLTPQKTTATIFISLMHYMGIF